MGSARCLRAHWLWATAPLVAVLVAVALVVATAAAGGADTRAPGLARDRDGRLVSTGSGDTPLEEQVEPTSTTAAAPAPTAAPRPAAKPPAAEDEQKRPGITIVASPGKPRIGETVRVTVKASMPANCCAIHVAAGDGLSMHVAAGMPCTAGVGGVQRMELTYLYNRPGTWNVEARADAGRRCDIELADRAVFSDGKWIGVYPTYAQTEALPQQIAVLPLVVTADGPYATTKQGPEAPTAQLTPVLDATGRGVELEGFASDGDGFVREAVVDWGDGTPATVYPNRAACREYESGWPMGSPLRFGVLPGSLGWSQVTAQHTYAAAGAYSVRVTVVSVGCDGTHEQRASHTLVIQAP